MKILMISGTHYQHFATGEGIYTKYLVNELTKMGYDITFITREKNSYKPLSFATLTTLKVFKLKFDLIHSHNIIPTPMLIKVSKIWKKLPLIYTRHGNEVWKYDKILLKFFDKVTVPNTELQKKYKKLGIKSVVIPSGVDTKLFFPSAKSNIEGDFVLYVGRFEQEKDPNTILEAAKINNNIKFIMIGEGCLEKQLRKKATSNVEFIKAIPHSEIPKYIVAARALILPSLREGFPLVLLEAMACGTPVITTPVGGIKDFITNNENGILIEIGNPKQLANAIEKVLTDIKLKEKLIKKGLETASKYSWEEVAKKVARVYEEVMEGYKF